MNPNCRKFISLFLVFSILMLSVNLYAKERRGAKLIVIKKDGGQIEGELITVKPNSLQLLEHYGVDVQKFWGEDFKKLADVDYCPTHAYLKLILDNVKEGKPLEGLSNNYYSYRFVITLF